MNRMNIRTKNVLFPVSDQLYGLFAEDINRAGDGGLYPEMIRNRSFEDSLPPDGCTVDDKKEIFITRNGWPGIFMNGEGLPAWRDSVPETAIPGWYGENVEMQLDLEDPLNENRKAALIADFAQDGRLYNIGYKGIPVRPDTGFNFHMFARASKKMIVTVSLQGQDGQVYSQGSMHVTTAESYEKYSVSMIAEGHDDQAVLVLKTNEPGALHLAFTSLLPAETFKCHGLRKDLGEMLAGLSPSFLRFPGGCIVEGFSEETAMRFPNTIGPAWERPGHQLMWYYRTTNGLGFHEYLQLCADLKVDAMYVCNCGMSCQGRGPEYFDGDTVDAMLQEALDAIEYALGNEESVFGAKRIEAGHLKPFPLKYIEIGNENFGPEYRERYLRFYEVIKENYPDLVLIANEHTEKHGLPADVVDEHFYNSADFFIGQVNRFDHYDRGGPKIFVGEYAVNSGEWAGTMAGAAAEAMFLTGIERNQDIVTMTAYAPLMQNISYAAWPTNLIVFDNHQVFGIPSYHMLALMAANRGKDVVELSAQFDQEYPRPYGVPGILAEKPGLKFKNARLNGQPVTVSREIYGTCEADGHAYKTKVKRREQRLSFEGCSKWANELEAFQNQQRESAGLPDFEEMTFLTFGEQDSTSCVFEIDLKFKDDNPVMLSIWNHRPVRAGEKTRPDDDNWSMHSVRRELWTIRDGVSRTEDKRYSRRPGQDDHDMLSGTPVEIDYRKYNTYKIICRDNGYDCYINDILIDRKDLPQQPALSAVATTDDDQVIIKLVNGSAQEKTVEIKLDCMVEREGEAEVLTADSPQAVNSMENKECVTAVTVPLPNIGQQFTYTALPSSVNVLKLKKH